MTTRPLSILLRSGLKAAAAGVIAVGLFLSHMSGPSTQLPGEIQPVSHLTYCHVHNTKPWKSSTGNYVHSRATSYNCGSGWKFYRELQRERWYGWERVDDDTWWGSASRTQSVGCSGSYTYRMIGFNQTPGGLQYKYYSDEVNISC